MARIFNRGAKVVIRHSFYDSSGDLTSPSTARMVVSYPSSGWPFRGVTSSVTYSMVVSTVGSTHADYLTWSTTIETGNFYPGPVNYHIRASDLTLSVADGEFILRGNPANLSITSTT